MIFVTVGSQKFPFNRLLKKVDWMVKKGIITEEVFVQTGASDYVPLFCRHQPFYARAEFLDMVEKCNIMIAHGGTGTIIDAIMRRKKIIAVPRLSGYGEHVDDHQCELPGRFHEMNLLYTCLDVERLPDALEKVRNHQFSEYHSKTEKLVASVDEYIQSLWNMGDSV